jgi:predicted flap endonuclease-1-like 5' DNA nuclease
MTLRILWFILAGFLLGFTISTLWEWFHFRRERIKLDERRVRELTAQLLDKERLLESSQAMASVAPVWEGAAYQSPGVFLETEEMAHPPPASESEGSRESPDPPPEDIPDVPAEPPPARFASLGATRDRPALGARNRDVKGGDLAPATVAVYQLPESTPLATATVEEKAIVTNVARPLVKKAEATGTLRRAVAYPDDLAKIRGIGEVYKFRLYQSGIFTWHQVTETDEETLRQATKAYPSANADEWGAQARKLAEKYGRVGATYAGPVPEDLTRIYGIGPVGTQTLYKAGICTYAQLAVCTPEELAPIFPIAVAGDEPDFEHWIQQAQQLAQKQG